MQISKFPTFGRKLHISRSAETTFTRAVAEPPLAAIPAFYNGESATRLQYFVVAAPANGNQSVCLARLFDKWRAHLSVIEERGLLLCREEREICENQSSRHAAL